jgi:hypothetical protein
VRTSSTHGDRRMLACFGAAPYFRQPYFR